MNEIVIAASDIAQVRKYLLSRTVEGCVVLYASELHRADGCLRLLVREVETPGPNDYSMADIDHAELKPAFTARVAKHARLTDQSLIFVHSHPGIDRPRFSTIDDGGEERLSAFLAHRLPGRTNAALVLSEGGICSRLLGTNIEIAVVALGESREVLFDPNDENEFSPEIFDRQIRAFGNAGQSVLRHLRIGIVGLGGTGSLIAQQLTHLGIRSFTLIDPDIIESTNLNRVVGATRDSVSHPKVDIAADYIRTFATGAVINSVQGDVVRSSIASHLKEVDCIFGCTDSHGSRSVLQQIAYQYMIPLFDVGSVIVTADGLVSHISGRAQMLSPGLACFACDDFLDPEQVRRDMMDDFQRKADPYITGIHEPAPAVISLNGTVASLVVTMFLAAVTGIPVNGRHLLYDAKKSIIRKVQNIPVESCYICSRSGSFARGDSWPLFARAD
jgi:molybdopterin/thiamine biosynthesis adenylyltransferase